MNGDTCKGFGNDWESKEEMKLIEVASVWQEHKDRSIKKHPKRNSMTMFEEILRRFFLILFLNNKKFSTET